LRDAAFQVGNPDPGGDEQASDFDAVGHG
jgi:hypothetical protein